MLRSIFNPGIASNFWSISNDCDTWQKVQHDHHINEEDQYWTQDSITPIQVTEAWMTAKQSCCMRIGSHFDINCVNITATNWTILPWVSEMKYLGYFIVRSNRFICCLDHAKRSFYLLQKKSYTLRPSSHLCSSLLLKKSYTLRNSSHPYFSKRLTHYLLLPILTPQDVLHITSVFLTLLLKKSYTLRPSSHTYCSRSLTHCVFLPTRTPQEVLHITSFPPLLLKNKRQPHNIVEAYFIASQCYRC